MAIPRALSWPHSTAPAAHAFFLTTPLATNDRQSYILTQMPPLVAHLTHIVATLRAAIGTHVARLTRPRHAAWIGDRFFIEAERTDPKPPIPLEAWTLLWNRLGRLATRFHTLYTRWQANTLPKPRPSRPRTARAETPAEQAPTLRLPRAHGWVNHRIPESAPPSGLLDTFLRQHEPELRQFLIAAPQAARYLRPLCQQLGLPQPDWLQRPSPAREARQRPHAPRPAASPRWPQGQRRPPTHPAPMLPGDKPLRPWVHRTANAWKKAGAWKKAEARKKSRTQT